MNQPTKGNLSREKASFTFGFDIGIASVGWAVLDDSRIIDQGVHCFDKAETADRGEPLNLARRTARLTRRRLSRRAWRLTRLARLLKREGLIPDADFFRAQPAFMDSAWELRKQGLDRKLEPNEWARVLYHLCKHRGFHWLSKAEEARAEGDAKGEGGKVKKGLSYTKALMENKGYRTAAEMVLAEFPEAQRNKQGSYDKALSRVFLDQELEKLFVAQRTHGNPHVSQALEIAIRGTSGDQPGDRRSGLFWIQSPMQSVLSMLGKCKFEPNEYRAPKASFTAERHVWLTRLSNLRVIVKGVSRALNEAERQHALLLPYQAGEKFTYKNLRNALVKAGLLPQEAQFGGLAYPSVKQKGEGQAKDPEEQILVKMPAWHNLRLHLKKAGLETEWQQMSLSALEGRPEQLDDIAWVLSVLKDDGEIRNGLAKLNLPGGERMVATLMTLSFDQFHAISLKALRRIVPLMERGLRYDEAVAQIPEYGHHSQRFVAGSGQHRYLPSLYEKVRTERGSMKVREDLDVPRNPVVLRALNQTRKVCNAMIREYGSPAAVHIEMARDLSRPLDERRDIETLQKEYADRNQKSREKFEEVFHRKPKGAEFEKWQLYQEQHGQCAYTQGPLDLDRVINDISYVQVDHALPYSRSYDDSKNNKVLVLTRENQNKGNRTAYEYLTSFAGGEDGERWRKFMAWVEGNKSYRQAKRIRLLRKNYGADEAKGFRDRNLNDTRYICKFFKNYVEEHLKFAGEREAQRCVVLNGQLTAFLRARWGLVKIRDESDRHHALDAVVIAACSHAMVKRLSDHARRKELEFLREGFPDPETGEVLNPIAHQHLADRFPEPWPHFRHELEKRLKLDSIDELRSEMSRLGTYPPEALQALRPLFVSRAPQRRNGGAAHKDTIYAQPERLRAQGGVTQKVPLSKLTLKDLDKLADPHRHHKLYAVIRERLEAHGGKGDKAFPADNPLRKPDKLGNATGPVVRSVTMVIDKLSGIPIRGGVAKNESMLRVDVFGKAGKFHLVPVYVHHRVKGLPNRAIVAFKDEPDWTSIDDSFEFLFSAHPNDLIRISFKSKPTILGYFASCHRGTGAFNVWAHDRNISVGKGGAIEGIGVKTALNLEKLHVDTLGRIYYAPPETRRGLA